MFGASFDFCDVNMSGQSMQVSCCNHAVGEFQKEFVRRCHKKVEVCEFVLHIECRLTSKTSVICQLSLCFVVTGDFASATVLDASCHWCG